MKKIKKTLYEIENKKNLVTQKIKEIEKSLFESAKNLSELKKYYYYNDIKQKGIRDVRNLFDLSIDEDYYKQIIIMLLIKVILNMKAKEIKTKFYQLNNILI